MSGAYSVFPLRLVVVSYSARTTNSRICVTVNGSVQFEHHQNRNTFWLFVTVTASVQFGHLLYP